MKFIFKQAVRSLVSTPFTTFFLIMTFTGGFFCIYIATGLIDAFLADTYSYMYGERGDYYAWVNTASTFNAESEPEGVTIASGYLYTGAGFENSRYIHGVPYGFESDFHARLTDGRFFEKNDFDEKRNVCIIEQELARKFKMSTGDIYKVMETDFEVVGIVKMNTWSDSVIVPDCILPDIPYSETYLQNYEIIVKTPAKDFSIDDLLETLTDERYRISLQGLSEQIYRQSMIEALGNITLVTAASIFIFMYAFLNLISIAEFRRSTKIKDFGIRLALGASERQLYFESMIEYLIIMLVSVVILFLMTPVVSSVTEDLISWRLGAVSLAGMPVIAVLFSAVTAGMMLAPMKKAAEESIINLLAERRRVS